MLRRGRTLWVLRHIRISILRGWQPGIESRRSRPFNTVASSGAAVFVFPGTNGPANAAVGSRPRCAAVDPHDRLGAVEVDGRPEGECVQLGVARRAFGALQVGRLEGVPKSRAGGPWVAGDGGVTRLYGADATGR
jgi:hypothetical protein